MLFQLYRANQNMGSKNTWVLNQGGFAQKMAASRPLHMTLNHLIPTLSHPTNPATKVGATASSRGANPPTNHHDSALLAGARRWLPLISKTVSARERSAAHLLAQLDNPPSWWKWSRVHHVSRWLTPHPGHGQRWERTERATGNERRATQ